MSAAVQVKQAYAVTPAEIAAEHGITAGRVLQYAADGRLPRIERGRYDIAYFSLMRAGESICRRRRFARPAGATLAGLGWLDATGQGAKEDRALFVRVLSRNGISRDRALQAFDQAKLLRRS